MSERPRMFAPDDVPISFDIELEHDSIMKQASVARYLEDPRGLQMAVLIVLSKKDCNSPPQRLPPLGPDLNHTTTIRDEAPGVARQTRSASSLPNEWPERWNSFALASAELLGWVSDLSTLARVILATRGLAIKQAKMVASGHHRPETAGRGLQAALGEKFGNLEIDIPVSRGVLAHEAVGASNARASTMRLSVPCLSV